MPRIRHFFWVAVCGLHRRLRCGESPTHCRLAHPDRRGLLGSLPKRAAPFHHYQSRSGNRSTRTHHLAGRHRTGKRRGLVEHFRNAARPRRWPVPNGHPAHLLVHPSRFRRRIRRHPATDRHCRGCPRSARRRLPRGPTLSPSPHGRAILVAPSGQSGSPDRMGRRKCHGLALDRFERKPPSPPRWTGCPPGLGH